MNNTATATKTIAFQTGRTYDTGRGDYVWSFTVVSRTAKFVTLRSDCYRNGTHTNDTKRVGVHTYNGAEACYPLGSYSQCAVIFADPFVEA